MGERAFNVFAPVSFFEKADAAPGESMRIGGVVSDELQDKQEETILQQGLDFAPFVKGGWFNDNHSKKTVDVLGYPDKDVQKFKKGQLLPDGTTAETHCSWAEGFLIPTTEGKKVWELGRALAKSGGKRRLGYSIEGKVKQRSGPNGRTVVKAEVHNIAITNCPVGMTTRMEALAKSMHNMLTGVDDPDLDKALSMGPATGAAPSSSGPLTGEGAGAILTPQHLEDDKDKEDLNKDPSVQKKDKDAPVHKSMAVATIQHRMSCSRETAERAYGLLLKQAAPAAGGTTMSKSALDKGLDTLQQLANQAQNERAAELFKKSQTGSITTEERAELMKSLDSPQSLTEEVAAPFKDNDVIKKAVDVSDYLREHNRSTVVSLETLAGHLEKSQGREQEFRVALAHTLLEMGAQMQSQGVLIKSLQETIETFGGQPARAPKSAGVAAPTTVIKKSFGGGGDPDALSKSQIEDAMSNMLEKGMDIVGGEDLLKASTKYEVTGLISPPVLEEVTSFIKSTTTKAA